MLSLNPATLILVAALNKDNLKSSLRTAAGRRSLDWGVTIFERFKAHKGSILLPRQRLSSLDVVSGALTVRTPERNLEFLADNMESYGGKVQDWFFRRPLPNEDGQGANIDIPAPRTLMDALSSPGSTYSAGSLEGLLGDSVYLMHFWNVYRQYSFKKQRMVTTVIARLPLSCLLLSFWLGIVTIVVGGALYILSGAVIWAAGLFLLITGSTVFCLLFGLVGLGWGVDLRRTRALSEMLAS